MAKLQMRIFEREGAGMRTLAAALALAGVLTVNGCGGKASEKKPAVKREPIAEWQMVDGRAVMVDFETPDTGVEWVPGKIAGGNGRAEDVSQLAETAATRPTTQEAGVIGRSSVRPRDGLWSLKIDAQVGADGEVVHAFRKPTSLRTFDTMTAGVIETDAPGRGGEWMARLFVVDEGGKKLLGDPMPVTARWQNAMLDLARAEEEGFDIERVVKVGVALENVKAGDGPLEIQTDTWSAGRDYKSYEGERSAKAKNFYVERAGTRLRVGMSGQYELTFYQRSGTERPWMSVSTAGGETMLGQNGTGLMLLDQNGFDALGGGVQQDAYDPRAERAESVPRAGWPLKEGALNGEERRDDPRGEQASIWRWECVWTSPVAAVVEMKQEVGAFDRLGEPAARLTWRFMIYQWGQMFVHVDWTGTNTAAGRVGRPISWALVTEEGLRWSGSVAGGVQAKMGEARGADAERLLSAIYPVSVKQGLRTALPHQMQVGAPVAMVAKGYRAGAEGKNVWWWAHGDGKRVFGSGLSTAPGTTSADCMMLVNGPDALMQASSFGSYLVPPKLRVRQGELDRNFPGDVDNDGMVDSYGFQVVRLSGGRASFMIYPQERPLFYPPYLFTVPAVERDAVDLAHSRVLINIDGKQFADPPRFPDGSFLLQLPYVIDRPVAVEAILVKK
jgi:hypothetical protein